MQQPSPSYRDSSQLSRETLAGQAERLGYVTAERDAARAELDALKVSQSPGAGQEAASIEEMATGALCGVSVDRSAVAPAMAGRRRGRRNDVGGRR